jgi:hypothetical protein
MGHKFELEVETYPRKAHILPLLVSKLLREPDSEKKYHFNIFFALFYIKGWESKKVIIGLKLRTSLPPILLVL